MKTPETFGNTCEDVPAHRDDVRERDAAVYCTIARWRYEQSNKRNTMIFDGLQCYGCNVFHGQKYVDVGCTNPEVITCTHSHKGFKHRFCIKTESTALGIVLTSGCATSRHCQQQELPGVSIHCCDSDLCNSATRRPAHSLQRALLLLVLARMCL
ncbi:ly6 PLAUR domain-containing 1-like protein [Labeo rohita]|uniref:Ly6 PLAUR domain-containing 1-like protein n=1 Tax=Labeo rohita TaxID=84645 RepID=A0A498LRK3_LABRO|nr:ly6 PLAUR domain-containing 1-like protein [Labeo rohita]